MNEIMRQLFITTQMKDMALIFGSKQVGNWLTKKYRNIYNKENRWQTEKKYAQEYDVAKKWVLATSQYEKTCLKWAKNSRNLCSYKLI